MLYISLSFQNLILFTALHAVGGFAVLYTCCMFFSLLVQRKGTKRNDALNRRCLHLMPVGLLYIILVLFKSIQVLLLPCRVPTNLLKGRESPSWLARPVADFVPAPSYSVRYFMILYLILFITKCVLTVL